MPKFPKEPYEGQVFYEPCEPLTGRSWIYEKGQWVDITNQEVKSED